MCVQICTVSDILHALQHPPPVRSAPRGLSGIGCRTCSVSSVRACVSCLAWSALVFARPGFGVVCSAACDVQSVRARWGHPGGIGPEARVGAVSPAFSDQNKKGAFFAKTHPTFTNPNSSDCASLQIFRKIQKGPLPGLICAILDRKKGAL